jgi:redox-regulated HSP33 family molecular chaperone
MTKVHDGPVTQVIVPFETKVQVKGLARGQWKVQAEERTAPVEVISMRRR